MADVIHFRDIHVPGCSGRHIGREQYCIPSGWTWFLPDGWPATRTYTTRREALRAREVAPFLDRVGATLRYVRPVLRVCPNCGGDQYECRSYGC